MVGSLDTENPEYFLLGDLNVDFKQSAKSPYKDKHKLNEIFDIYGLHQFSNKPTWITKTSCTLIDLCLTNSVSMVVDSGVIHLSIIVTTHWSTWYVRPIKYGRALKQLK
jgi:hypothetical protein